MKIFITGATGFIGKALVEELLSTRQDIVRIWSLARRPTGTHEGRVIELRGDLGQLNRFTTELLESDYVFHLAADATFGNSADYDTINFRHTRELVDILKNNNRLQCLIFTSTIGAVDRTSGDRCQAPLRPESVPSPRSRYGQSKLKAEQYIANSGLNFTIIRPTWVYGQQMRAGSHINKFVTLANAGSAALRLDFPGRVSLIHVRDLARALAHCINNPRVIGRTYIALTESLPVGHVMQAINQRVRSSANLPVPLPPLRQLLAPLHSYLPIQVAILFLDYLWAEDPSFLHDFDITDPIHFSEGLEDVLSTNAAYAGHWVITGANSGIGLALAAKLHCSGKKLILIDKQIDALSAFPTATIIQADLSDRIQLMEITERLQNITIRCLINNAGVGFRKAHADIAPEEIDLTLAVNTVAPLYLTRQLINTLRRCGTTIVNIASSVAYIPLPYMSHYAASKAALVSWSEALSHELRPGNVVMTVTPSGTRTNFQQTAGVRDSKNGKTLLSPDKVACAIIKGVAKRQKILFIGPASRLFELAGRLLPRMVSLALWGKLFDRYR